jgi:hypothetical protein
MLFMEGNPVVEQCLSVARRHDAGENIKSRTKMRAGFIPVKWLFSLGAICAADLNAKDDNRGKTRA